jgi:hypothetical protein
MILGERDRTTQRNNDVTYPEISIRFYDTTKNDGNIRSNKI